MPNFSFKTEKSIKLFLECEDSLKCFGSSLEKQRTKMSAELAGQLSNAEVELKYLSWLVSCLMLR